MPRKPTGQPTRGKTALNRLRQVDVYVALAWPEVLAGKSPLVVDLGFGAFPWTTLEMAGRWRRINPRLRFLGVEIDPERVAAALPFAEPPGIDFKLGGFNLTDLLGAERARVIRCYNVLRQYDEAAVAAALDRMAEALEVGGLLIEGTSNPTGRMVAFELYRRTPTGLERLETVFGTNFREVLEPVDFQTILPKRLIHRMLDDAPARFFAAWKQARAVARGQGHAGVRRNWTEAGRLLRERFGYPADVRRRLLRRGFLAVRMDLGATPPGGVPGSAGWLRD